MNFLDIRTIFAISIIVFSICTLVVVSLWRQYRYRFDGMNLLAADFVLQSAATFMFVMRGQIDDWPIVGDQAGLCTSPYTVDCTLPSNAARCG